ncbi:MAG TPA: anaerobic carbon-monoxide dehydrogenase catalytic subunit [Methanoregulaceae archaeon]|nr:MAG: anaerobic carbon-monoxide dehydrogenase catalytic subunit [Methanolinea sp.]HON80809.1 anaerobic carbon-monoxide dehydrogenase catalytic subunit [Methanoregulaceae archaeon]HPD09544.1 anaerobic carbon-monoxide dehydrogenase catalytic subunit [Methanoregulaceae archaeon]HRT15215.1 anaerobic carbon-monoxide dehydrogenase catalytic subunit [Methanoregulaceae archaeon]HRU30786.1 anaerobic carbon-monoxide dehydrogenase catalytic subunit [Methanoregulaceae archaeon]
MTEETKPILIGERQDVCELDRARLALMNPELIEQKKEERTFDEAAKPFVEMTMREGIETVWDRFEMQQPPCKQCESGLSCSRCAMGPCRIIPPYRIRGVCGADSDLIVARNLLDTIATGAAAHSDHGREIVSTLYGIGIGTVTDYVIADPEKLRRLAEEYGLKTDGKDDRKVAGELGRAMLEEYGSVKDSLQIAQRAPKATREIWENTGISPRGVDRDVVDAMHRVHMGVGADYANILAHGLRVSLSDGWGGSSMATEISDVLFGTPEPNESLVNLGVVKKSHVNISLHGHNPMLSEMAVKAAQDPEILALVKKVGAAGVNLVGLCCTGNELLMRKGIPNAGNHFNQELVITTGALEAMVVDYQCIFPSLPRTASCYHTHVISTSPKSKIPGSYYVAFEPEDAYATAKTIVKMAVENFPNRNPGRVFIPIEPVKVLTGFSVEAIRGALGGTLKPLIDQIAAGNIRGAVGIVGCNNPKVKHDYGHVTLSKELIKRDILCVETGCAAIASGKAGLLQPSAASLAGPGLRVVCESLGIPPVLHMGSCVDCSRILHLAAELGNALNIGIHRLPVAGAAPEWYSQKAVSIGSYFVASGVYTVLGVMPKITGSPPVVSLLTEGLKSVVNASFAVEPDPLKAADLITDHIERKRTELGI